MKRQPFDTALPSKKPLRTTCTFYVNASRSHDHGKVFQAGSLVVDFTVLKLEIFYRLTLPKTLYEIISFNVV